MSTRHKSSTNASMLGTPSLPQSATGFALHTLETAPTHSKGLLRESETSMGFIPNLFAIMAESPPVIEAYQTLNGLFNHSSFSSEEKTVIWQTINRLHHCHYCQAAHGAIAEMMHVNKQLSEQLLEGRRLDDAQLEALCQTTQALVEQRGELNPAQLADFYNHGYERKHLLEIILGISQKVMSNYINHLAETPIDTAFQGYSRERTQ